MKPILTSRNWDRLLAEIEEGKLIPVVGPELLQMDMGDGPVLFYQHLADELAQRLEVDSESISEPIRLNEVAWDFLDRRGDPAEIYYEIQDILKKGDWPMPEPLLKLAQILHFDLYLSTTFDPFMKRALDETRFGGMDQTESLANSILETVVDLPTDFKDHPRPLVYQLFGRATTSPEYAVTDDELLAFTHRLQTRDYRPANLFDHIKPRHLLMLGCSFPDWLARFFYCALKGEDILTKGIRGLVADTETVRDGNLCRFLKRGQTLIFPEGDAVQFVSELHDKWMARFEAQSSDSTEEKDALSTLAPFGAEAIFLSYASEDRDAVLRFKEKMESMGLNVWYDQRRLETGDLYMEKIFANIRKASFFIPFISKNTTTVERRFFRLEWHKALEEAQYRPSDYPFIQPIAIDNTGYDAPTFRKPSSPATGSILKGAFRMRTFWS